MKAPLEFLYSYILFQQIFTSLPLKRNRDKTRQVTWNILILLIFSVDTHSSFSKGKVTRRVKSLRVSLFFSIFFSRYPFSFLKRKVTRHVKSHGVSLFFYICCKYMINDSFFTPCFYYLIFFLIIEEAGITSLSLIIVSCSCFYPLMPI